MVAATRTLFPPHCRVAAAPVNGNLEHLGAQEVLAVQKASPKRQGEFAAGRLAARRALADLGVRGIEIPVGPDREPVWPPNIIGSISHAGELAVAVVAWAHASESIGIDIEVNDALHAELWPLVLVSNERAWIESRPIIEQRPWATVIFSAKEAFYKFQHPLTRCWLDFRDVEIGIQSADTFTIKVLQPPVPLLATAFFGRATRIDGFTVTAIHRPRGN